MDDSHLVLAFYHIAKLEDPKAEVKAQKAFCQEHDLMGRIYVAEHGINGQMSATPEAANAYMEWLKSHSPFEDVVFKLHTWHEHCFPRLTIKTRPKLVAIDIDIDWKHRGTSVTPEKWRELMESDDCPPIFDVRNDYEWEIGRFKGSKKPPCNTFRDFEKWADDLKQEHNPEKPVMMCCTGGIRCELFSSMLLRRGFKTVYQLGGGIINYGLKEGSKHWEGKLFVFDDRLVVPISEEPTETVGRCSFCSSEIDDYYNCANMECNDLFLSCKSCLKEHIGCCCTDCTKQERVRPYHEQERHKPFKRLHLCQTS